MRSTQHYMRSRNLFSSLRSNGRAPDIMQLKLFSLFLLGAQLANCLPFPFPVLSHFYILSCQIGKVRTELGQLSAKSALYCSDASIARYLIARNWDVKKATKMLKKTLKWRSEYKPDEIRWVSFFSLINFFGGSDNSCMMYPHGTSDYAYATVQLLACLLKHLMH